MPYFPMLDQLNTEWAALDETSDIQSWANAPALAGCRTLNDVLVAISQSPDPVLAELISRAQDGDQLARRTVLQTMLGKLVRMASSGKARTHEDSFCDLVTALWARVATYPLASRPVRIAANLSLDALHQVHADWRRETREVPFDMDRLPIWDAEAAPAREPLWPSRKDSRDASTASIVQVAAVGEWMPPEWLAIVEAVYGERELTGAEAAGEFGCLPSSLRSRCRRAVTVLRDHRAELVGVA